MNIGVLNVLGVNQGLIGEHEEESSIDSGVKISITIIIIIIINMIKKEAAKILI